MNILNYPDYIEAMYEQDPEIITGKIQKIIQQSLDPMAPVRTIQIKPQTNKVLSEEAKTCLAERDLAPYEFKISNNQDDLRYYKNLKNKANNLISKEFFF